MLTLWTTAALAAPLPNIDAPLKTGARAEQDAAVVVGIESYYELPEVPYAKRDAQAFADYLLYTRGIPADRIARLPKANREKLLAAIEVAAGQAGRDGTVWVYFAGHGGASPETGERLLMGIDVQPDLATFTARSVPVAQVKAAASAEGSRAILVLDTCYTGQGRSGSELLPGKRFAVPSYATAATPRVLEWSAASANQFSGPLESTRHGAFTWAVLGALRGWADGQLDDERDGVVHADEARLYVEEALRALQVRDQVPVLVAENPRDWVLAAHPGLESPPALVGAPVPTAAAPAPAAPPPDSAATTIVTERQRVRKTDASSAREPWQFLIRGFGSPVSSAYGACVAMERVPRSEAPETHHRREPLGWVCPSTTVMVLRYLQADAWRASIQDEGLIERSFGSRQAWVTPAGDLLIPESGFVFWPGNARCADEPACVEQVSGFIDAATGLGAATGR